MKEAVLYEKLPDQRVQCHVCVRHCIISAGKCGFCQTRENKNGQLFTLIYDQVSSACLDPVEKKPLYHFHPGSRVFSLGTLGCSFACPGCQNWQISQRKPEHDDPSLIYMTPKMAVDRAQAIGADGICWTYNDPAIWVEHTVEGAKLAKEHGLSTIYVTNGTATKEHLDLIGPYLDAYRVDIKAFSTEGYGTIAHFSAYEQILAGVQYARERWGMHIECVTNVTPGINDSDVELSGIANWIATVLGIDTPWHITRFYPYQGFEQLPITPLERIDQAYNIGKSAGLRYIYVGNVANDPRQNTVCPQCARTLVARTGYSISHIQIEDGKCPACGMVIAGRW